ncbi:(2Fe-2S) ferredoxin domain-containing protein [Lyngbya sp. CCY1209]|uniref:(2Fe-2S) ferredoxin domain-containing protein n=1 Tax=Lyngbya sp. CCY1209 TaxID=2886103 RepID=UPI002D202264|nr:(2Fe-2S) ferredoxin domain-containing protein [Lyngbya sp. CCY1209]MEB3885221.1 (2Fe-2S) ferredoxin domain-containing protein [Lyngbya sp. CCY1209]
MSKFNKQVSEFILDGRVLQVFYKGSRPKVLQLMADSGLYTMKLSKDLRSQAERILTPGAEVRVGGEKTLNFKKGTIKLKAYEIYPLGETPEIPAPPPRSEDQKCQKPAKILICQKSDCCKRGARAVCEALEAQLCDRGLEGQVKIQKTGCLKKCKLGPNLVVMPDKARYTRVRPEDISEVIEKHLISAREDRPDAGATERMMEESLR